MSNDRDINDILDSLNQLLREGESHNDDHVETDEQAGEIEAEPHELEEDDAESKEVALEVSDSEEEMNAEEPEQVEGDVEPFSDAADEISSEYLDDLSEEESEDTMEAPISVQRVVLTEEMLVNNPQGNLLSMVNGDRDADAEQTAEPKPYQGAPSELEEVTEQETILEDNSENRDSNSVSFPSNEQLEQLVAKVSDDVIAQMQQKLPSLIKASLHRSLSELRDEETRETDQSENHSEE